MRKVRTVFFYVLSFLTMVLWSVLAIPVYIFITLFRLPYRWFYAFCLLWCRWVIFQTRWLLGIRIRLHGQENLAEVQRSPCVVMSKHQSALETLLIMVVMKVPACYVFKRELFFIPFLGHPMWMLKMIPIDRRHKGKIIHKLAEAGKERLKAGISVLIFPEGTRIPRGQVGTYHRGGVVIASAAETDIIPVAVTSARCWGKGLKGKHPGIVDLSFGPAINATSQDSNQVLNQVKDWIETEMRRLDPGAYA